MLKGNYRLHAVLLNDGLVCRVIDLRVNGRDMIHRRGCMTIIDVVRYEVRTRRGNGIEYRVMKSYIVVKVFFDRADDASPCVYRRVIGGWRWEKGRQGIDVDEERERDSRKSKQ